MVKNSRQRRGECLTRTRGGGEEEEEEGLFKADAVNEEDPERDRATPALKVWTRGGVGGGAGHQSLNCVGQVWGHGAETDSFSDSLSPG